MLDNVNRLLVVDGDRRVIESVTAVGARFGFEVRDASDPDAFLGAVAAFVPTVIFLDVELAGLDGVEALHVLGRQGCTASLVLIGNADGRVLRATASIGASRNLNMAGCLPKPLDPEDVAKILKRYRQEDRRITRNEIERGLDNHEFIAFYQPIVSAAPEGGWVADGVEALARWQHPSKGIVMPDDFIPVAEETGLICGLTAQILEQSLENLNEWGRDGLDLRCSINLPPSLVTDLDFPDEVAATLARHRIDPKKLSFELTETATMQDPATTMDILTRLRVKGIGLALDDFGTGYSSLTRLYQMPFDEMKIDRSLGMNVPGSREANTIVGSLIELAHNLGMRVCTEGVETRAGLDLLQAFKSDRCQGFHISRALPSADIPSFLERWNHAARAPRVDNDLFALV